jgi:hypothetical protein
MEADVRRAKTVLVWSAVALAVWATLAANGGSQSENAKRLTTPEHETSSKGGAIAKIPKRTQAEAENSCADPAACREANRKAYARVGKPDWIYADSRDPMRGTAIRSASIDSANRLEFAFPYDGGSTATLSLRKMNGDLNVMLSVNKGQLICYGMGNTEVRAKFDGREIEDYSCGRAADGSSNVLFIRSESSFLASLKKAKTLIVEATFYQAGARQMTFHVEGLVWK